MDKIKNKFYEIKDKFLNMELKKLVVVCACILLVIAVITFIIFSIVKYNKNKLEDASLYDLEATILYRQYINYSTLNTMHENMTRDNSLKYMTIFSINNLLKVNKVNLSEKYSNCFKDGVYVLDGDKVEDKIHELFGDDVNVDFEKIFTNYDASVNNIKIDDTKALETLKKYNGLNTYSIDGVYKSKKNEFWLYDCSNKDNTLTVNTKITKIEKNKDTIIIYDNYYLKQSNDEEVKYTDTNGGTLMNKRKIGHYKHVFKKIDKTYRWESTTKID